MLPPTRHRRAVVLRLRGSLVTFGRVRAPDAFEDCAANVAVEIQLQRHGRWTELRSDVTDENARYRTRVPDRAKPYRAVAPRSVINGGSDVCRRAVSRVRIG